jgi:hypothetical protein
VATSAEFEQGYDAVAAEAQLAPATTLVDARGFTVLGHADGELAIWSLTTASQRGWAAVERGDVSSERARALLGVLDQRAIVGLNCDTDVGAVGRLADAARVRVCDSARSCWLDVFQLFEDVADVRARLAAVGSEPSYKASMPTLQRDLGQALAALKVVPPQPESAAARQALAVCVLFSAALRLWEDTEIARVRRKNLHPYGGPWPRPVHERWRSALTRAYSDQFQL